MVRTPHQPVFIDHSGRRWRRIRRAVLGAGIVTTLLTLAIVVGLLVPPFAPSLPLTESASAGPPHFVGTRAERERIAFRRRLRLAMQRHRVPPARHAARIPVARTGGKIATPGAGGPTHPIVAGFYVNWEDNSRASLEAHLGELDWVIGEWAFLQGRGDSLIVSVDTRVFDVVRERTPDPRQRPALFAMVSNFDTTTKRFSPEALGHMLGAPAARARVLGQLRQVVAAYGLAGITVDFEDVPDALEPAVVAFLRDLRAALAPVGGKVLTTVHANTEPALLARLAAQSDYVLPMLFDEHYQGGDPGPVASQAFYAQRAREIVSVVPPRKVVLMIGAYGYNWNDAAPPGSLASAETMTFQETMRRARENGAATRFDSASLNPYVTWTDPDSTDHVVWYLDGATAWNEVRVGDSLGVAGQAVWRLGDEDRALWHALRRQAPDSLRVVPPGYDVEFRPETGGGEILHIAARPRAGERALRVDRATGLVVADSIAEYPTPYVVDRFGASAHRIALTFDDGPDARWTSMLLDTLRRYHAPATFFVIGENADTHLPLLRRMYREGHEIGNHTYSHPNLALTSPERTKLEIDANERLLEAVLDRRTAFFRPPYFGDATPTTADELDPVGIATARGYYTIGLRIDGEDWREPDPQRIIRNVLGGLDSGNVVLLHDGGGNRAATVRALGPLIDSLRARGDTLVLVSALAGLTRAQAMPPLGRMGELRRLGELGAFGLLGAVEIALYWVFFLAVILGIARLAIIGSLALVQRARKHQVRGAPTPYAPPVSVVVPAYNEGKVILGTLASLLRQEYAGELEIIVVDDGSTDDTLATVREAYGGEPGVVLVRKSNGGKASALNMGIARARHEIVICLDADTIFATDTVAELVQPLADPRVGAVAGNAKVGNRINLVTRWQALEYVTSQNLDRRAFSLLDCITVVPGAVGAWRRRLVQEVGGFREDTLAEDQELTLAILRGGHSIAYADGAVGYTEAPDTLRGLAKQRFRWSFGTLQCAWKYARWPNPLAPWRWRAWWRGPSVLFKPRHGALGLVAMPNVWLFQLLLPAISPIADLMFVWSLASVWLTYQAHGGTYALTSLEHVMTYYAVFLVVDWLASIIAFLMEPGEEKQLTWLIFLQRFAYRQVMYWVVVRSFAAALRGRVVGWGKLERKATVELPAA